MRRLLLDNPPCRRVVVCCGRGNNGGDGLVIARHLANAGVGVKVLGFFTAEALAGDALINYRILAHTRVPIVLEPDPQDRWLDDELKCLGGLAADWIVDALLGTGATGAPRPPLDRVIAAMNRAGSRRFSVDIPSGLDCDHPQADAVSVKADITATFVALKPCLVASGFRAVCGHVHVVDIGVPSEILSIVENQPANGS